MGWRWGAQGKVVGGWLGVWADVFGCSATPTRCRAPLCARLALVLAVAAVADDEENARCGGAPSALGSVRCGGLQAGAGRGRLLTGGWAGRWGGEGGGGTSPPTTHAARAWLSLPLLSLGRSSTRPHLAAGAACRTSVRVVLGRPPAAVWQRRGGGCSRWAPLLRGCARPPPHWADPQAGAAGARASPPSAKRQGGGAGQHPSHPHLTVPTAASTAAWRGGVGGRGRLLPHKRSAHVVAERPHLQHCAAAWRWWARAPGLQLLQRSPC